MSVRHPYQIEGPAQICFSGGRTSAYMLKHIVDASGGRLPPDVHVIFTNTGKERVETLDFVHECATRWNVPVVWLEWAGFVEPGRSRSYFKQVSRFTASLHGEPFKALIRALGYLPNPTQRVCTARLKVSTSAAYMRGLGYDTWNSVMGIRADEPARVAKLRNPARENSEGVPELPLARLGVSKRDVAAFWRAQNEPSNGFDLRLENLNGTTPHGNCDLCFLKGAKQLVSLIRERPDAAIWWMAREEEIALAGSATTAATFRNDRPTYAAMYRFARNHAEMYPFDDEPIADCYCGDGS